MRVFGVPARRERLETMSAHNGFEALRKMRQRTPCVVLLDMQMPVMDGWEFRRRQLHDPSHAHVPVVAVTAHYDPARIEQQLGVKMLTQTAIGGPHHHRGRTGLRPAIKRPA